MCGGFPAIYSREARQMAEIAQQRADAAMARVSWERKIARLLKEDLNVDVNPQALRVFIRARWAELSLCAHRIHEGK
jgi:hypothetical protein